jgi:hypothetical protein
MHANIHNLIRTGVANFPAGATICIRHFRYLWGKKLIFNKYNFEEIQVLLLLLLLKS